MGTDDQRFDAESGQSHQCRRPIAAEHEEPLVLFEAHELGGPLRRLGQNGRHNALPQRGQTLLAVHLRKAIEHAVVVDGRRRRRRVHGAAAASRLQLQACFDQVQRMHYADFDEARGSAGGDLHGRLLEQRRGRRGDERGFGRAAMLFGGHLRWV